MTAGTNATSVWAKISGGGGGIFAAYDITGATAYNGGDEVFVGSQVVCNGITVLPGVYRLLSTLSVPASPAGNQIPQIPVPATETIFWIPTSAGMVVSSTCAIAGTQQIYVNATAPF
jgi:hypothetical protein